VAPTGSDAASGTESAPFRSVGKALSLVQPGEAVFLKSGTYSERLRLEEKGGSATRGLTLKAAPGATPTLRGGGGSSTSMIDVRGAYWRIEGLTVDVAGDRSFAVLWRGAGSHHGVLRNSTLKNGTAGAGANVSEYAHDVLIEGNTIFNFNRSGRDSHGVIVQTTSRNVVVRGNDIHHNSGDAVQCIGPEGGATLSGTPFDNLLVEDNALHENRENGVDIKTCTRVTLRGNHIYGHRRSSTSKGEGIVVHLSARDVIIEDNELSDNGRAINIGGVRQGPPPTNVVIRRNVLHDGRGVDGDEGTGIRVDTSINVAVLHNTIWNMPGSCLGFGNGDSGPSRGLDARNNILAHCGLTLRVGSGRDGARVDGNLYASAAGSARFRLDGVDTDFSGWRSATGLDRRSLERAPAFMDATDGDFRLAVGSPARDAGLALSANFCGQGPDIGALESDCP
jgi:nitrous oxidase accessory protein NosD